MRHDQVCKPFLSHAVSVEHLLRFVAATIDGGPEWVAVDRQTLEQRCRPSASTTPFTATSTTWASRSTGATSASGIGRRELCRDPGVPPGTVAPPAT